MPPEKTDAYEKGVEFGVIQTTLHNHGKMLNEIKEALNKLPCDIHLAKLVRLEVKAGMWGALSGVAAAILSFITFKKLGG